MRSPTVMVPNALWLPPWYFHLSCYRCDRWVVTLIDGVNIYEIAALHSMTPHPIVGVGTAK
jgi:hypothetical protein